MSSNFVPNFKPSTRGLRFINDFPHQADITVNVPLLGNVPIGDAYNGVCGGMVFAVRDFFEANHPAPADTAPPAQGSPLFNFIVQRLFDSFNLPGGVTKYYQWMTTPDHDTGVWPVIRHGVVWHTVVEEWPKIRADIDSGHPSPLGLVTVYDVNPADLGHNHQVMAYGYEVDANNKLTLHLYDPNTGASDGCYLSMSLSDPSHSTPIQHNVAIGFPIRGFFRVDYAARDVSGLIPAPSTFTASCTPHPVKADVPQTLTVHAKDARTGAPVAGSVQINGATVGKTNQPFTYTFLGSLTRRRLPNTGSGRPGPGDLGLFMVYPSGQIIAAGYLPVAIDFGLKNHWVEKGKGSGA